MPQELSAEPPESTLLTYVLGSNPDPLQVSSFAILTLTATNTGDRKLLCEQVVVTLPTGTNAKDLIAGGPVEAAPPAGWSMTVSGGVVAFTAPSGGATVGADGLVFTLAIFTNGQPGASSITIAETMSDGVTRTTTKPANKFPVDFTLVGLSLVPDTVTQIVHGQPAYLSWTAAGDGVTCQLIYQPSDSGDPQPINVHNTPDGPSYQTVPLTRTGDVTFTLIASKHVLGQDEPLTLQSTLTVPIQTLGLTLEVQPAKVGVNGLAQIIWDAPNADYCKTGDGQRLPASGTAYVILQKTTPFTITAFAGEPPHQQTAQQQKQITVDPAIAPKPNGNPGYTTTGTTGAPGATGADMTIIETAIETVGGTEYHYQVNVGATVAYGMPDGSISGRVAQLNGSTWPLTAPEYIAFQQAANGGTGAAGEDLLLAVTLPPLDTSSAPAQVIPIRLTGGAGGPGGTSGSLSNGVRMGSYPVSMSGGNGGRGGNVRLEITVDPTQPPAQYVLVLAGGPGGAGGTTGHGFQGSSGAAGPSGSVALAFDGTIIPASGQLVAPRPFEPLALRVAALPMVVAPNGLARLKWRSPNADYCVLPDGSVVPPNGNALIVVAQSGPLTVTAYDAFGRQIAESALVTVDPSIVPTESGGSQTGGPGQAGGVGIDGNWVYSEPQPVCSPGSTGGTGGGATIAMTVPPLDISGTSRRVISLTAIGGKGGSGGKGGCLMFVDWGGGYDGPAQLPDGACAGGDGGLGGNAAITLTTDPTQAPAQFIVNIAPGAGGGGGQSGWSCNFDGSGGPTTSQSGAPGTVSLIVDGVPGVVPPPDADPSLAEAAVGSVSRADLIRERHPE